MRLRSFLQNGSRVFGSAGSATDDVYFPDLPYDLPLVYSRGCIPSSLSSRLSLDSVEYRGGIDSFVASSIYNYFNLQALPKASNMSSVPPRQTAVSDEFILDEGPSLRSLVAYDPNLTHILLPHCYPSIQYSCIPGYPFFVWYLSPSDLISLSLLSSLCSVPPPYHRASHNLPPLTIRLLPLFFCSIPVENRRTLTHYPLPPTSSKRAPKLTDSPSATPPFTLSPLLLLLLSPQPAISREAVSRSTPKRC